MEYKKIILKQFIDERGSLLPLEFDSIDFEPKRIFIVNNVPVGTVRGDHAHFTTKQLLICSKCSVNVFLDDGFEKQKIVLVKGEAILVPELIWDSQEFTEENSELIVLCSTKYDINDYILDYEFFKNTKGYRNT